MIPKFRAWDMREKEHKMQMVEGINWHGEGIWFNKIYDDETSTDWCDFEDCKLMQSTGLIDINGIEIYQDDIIVERWENFHGKHERIKAVSWDERENGWNILNPIKTSTGMNYEVIGNIHEHPDLLE
ncbi:YopX family protein [Macrococcoides caseolyticum]|uniref:YopX family protein n=1 Tax=Macrococcoides caseolyticum TaxID=69966 RepID=UPI000C33BB71|nr:YopX family protein [Macrococcus caseolyticus]PKF14026.1 hypothetical protein CW690_08745 [Macrococcus caseolyticus]